MEKLFFGVILFNFFSNTFGMNIMHKDVKQFIHILTKYGLRRKRKKESFCDLLSSFKLLTCHAKAEAHCFHINILTATEFFMIKV